MPDLDAEQLAYTAGYSAYPDASLNNPYSAREDGLMWMQWRAGWEDARDEEGKVQRGA